MPLTNSKLGHVLLHIYEFPFYAVIYLPAVVSYNTDTPCIVAWAGNGEEEMCIHESCLNSGFRNWLNVAVVSDTCDDAPHRKESSLIAAFNEDCREGGWLRKMMNYRRD